MTRTSRTLFILVAASLLALALVSERAGAPAPAGADDLVVSPEVKAQVANQGRARVIVELQPAPGALVPEGQLPTAAHVAAQRANIAFAQSQVLSRLQGRGHALVHQFQTVPYLALEVEPDALAALAVSAFYVRRVEEDTLNAPLLPQSVPLIEDNQVWAAGYDGTGIMVAILDTGVDKTHPFLAGKVLEEACYSSGTSLCPSGQSQQIGPGAGINCPLSIFVCFHGTHVAGIAAGNGAGAGVSFSGVAKGAQIMAVQVFSRFGSSVAAYTSDIMAGLERVYSLRNQYNFSSVNLSLGGGFYSGNCDFDPTKPSIDNLRSVGIATVVAAGNDGYTSMLDSPACVSSAVSVGSTDKSDVVSSFSNVAPFLSLLAPGGSILSSYPGAQFATFSGTSMATPHVTGAWAVLKQAAPGASVSAILTALQQTGVLITDTRAGGTVTKPRVRIAQALSALGASPPPAGPLAAAVLPGSRSVQVGTPATAFATIINAGTVPAKACGLAPLTSLPAAFLFQTTNPANNALISTPNTPVDIPAGGLQTYMFAFTPTAPITPTEVALTFSCTNAVPAPVTTGVNTFLLAASATPVPDTIALMATISGDGVVRIASSSSTQLFAIGTSNVGVTGTITVSADTGGVSLPLTLTVCETNAVGTCLAPPGAAVTVTYAGGTNKSFNVLVQASGSIPFSPAVNRVFVRLKTPDGVQRGATSAAVCTSC